MSKFPAISDSTLDNKKSYRKPPRQQIEPTWNYAEIEKYKVEDERVCPICQHKSKYSICPGCWFQRGGFIPTLQMPEGLKSEAAI